MSLDPVNYADNLFRSAAALLRGGIYEMAGNQARFVTYILHRK